MLIGFLTIFTRTCWYSFRRIW